MGDEVLRELTHSFSGDRSAATAMKLAQEATRQAEAELAKAAFCLLLDVKVWKTLERGDRLTLARLLEAWIEPRGLSFVRLRVCRQQDVEHEIALFEDEEGREFALVPAGKVEIGYDPDAFDPTHLNAEMEEWAEQEREAFEADGPEAVAEVVQDVETKRLNALEGIRRLNSPRTVALQPMLVEVRPEHLWGTPRSHDEVVELLQSQGFRLPHSDEWEYFCAAETKTLFRWGDAFPASEGAPEVAAPNAFGLHFHTSPAGAEHCLEPGVTRNGDGGVGLCGGEGPVAFLPLSAWHLEGSPWHGGLVRRVLDLDNCLRELDDSEGDESPALD